MLYPLALYGAVCQLHLNKTRGGKSCRPGSCSLEASHQKLWGRGLVNAWKLFSILILGSTKNVQSVSTTPSERRMAAAASTATRHKVLSGWVVSEAERTVSLRPLVSAVRTCHLTYKLDMEVDGEEEEPWSFLFNVACFPAHNHTLISTGNEWDSNFAS